MITYPETSAVKGLSVTVAVAALPGSATEIAVTVTVLVVATVDGAV